MEQSSRAVEGPLDATVGRDAGPWDALLRAPRRGLTPLEDSTQAARARTKLASLLDELATVEGLPTAALGVRCDLDSRQVWGLLKAPREAGQVRFDGCRWSLAADYPGRDVQRAADLLRAKGWLVTPPNVEVERPVPRSARTHS